MNLRTACGGALLLLAAASAHASPGDTGDAVAALGPEIAEWNRECPEAGMAVDGVGEAELTPAVNVVIVRLEGDGGAVAECFGKTEPRYVMIKIAGRWRGINRSGFGYGVRFEPLAAGQSVATLVEGVPSQCEITYTWRAGGFVAGITPGCLVDQSTADERAAELSASVRAALYYGADPLAPPEPVREEGNSGPKQRLEEIVETVGRRRLLNRADPGFVRAMQPHVTRGFLAAVQRGAKIAGKISSRRWEADFGNAMAGIAQVRIWNSTIIEEHDGNAVVISDISLTGERANLPVGDARRMLKYWMKMEDGVWKIDDVEGIPNVDDLRSNPHPRRGQGSHAVLPTARQRLSDPLRYRK